MPSTSTPQATFGRLMISTLNPAQHTQRSIFSSSIGQYSAEQQTIPGVRIDVSNLRPTTRFTDLYEGLQKEIELLDTFILNQMNLQSECELAMPRIASTFEHMPADVEYCTRKLDAVQRALETDAGAIESARGLVKSDADAAKLSFKAIHNLRMPAQFHHASLWNAPGASAPTLSTSDDDGGVASADLIWYFNKQADEMTKKLSAFKRNIDDVEAHLSGLESQTVAQAQSMRMSRGKDGSGRSADDQVRELAAVLRVFEEGLLKVAGRVGGAREEVQEVMLADGSWGRR